VPGEDEEVDRVGVQLYQYRVEIAEALLGRDVDPFAPALPRLGESDRGLAPFVVLGTVDAVDALLDAVSTGMSDLSFRFAPKHTPAALSTQAQITMSPSV
jgi:hypothetical protein